MTHGARAVAVRYPHLVGIRAKAGRKLFARLSHGLEYLLFLRRECRRRGVRVLAWWLGTARIYLVMLPPNKAGMSAALGEAHRQYARRRNAEAGSREGLFKPHYDSCVVKWDRLADAARFVEQCGAPAVAAAGAREKGRRGPRLRLVVRPWKYLWSSARYNCRMRALDPLVARREVRKLVADWRAFVSEPAPAEEAKAVRRALRTGRVLGDRIFAARMSRSTQQRLRKKKPGPKPKPEEPIRSWPYRQYEQY